MNERRGRRSPSIGDRQRDPERTRARILEAASAEFAAHGYAGARVSAIASRAQVNQQLISYYFDGKLGLYRALADQWRERESDVVPTGTPLADQVRRYALEALHNSDGVRLLAWGGLEYDGPDTDPDHTARNDRLTGSVTQIRELQAAGRLPDALDPACFAVMLIAASMATTTLPHVIEGLCHTDPRSDVFVHYWADQIAALVEALTGTTPTSR